MRVIFQCPGCGFEMASEAQYAGQEVACPQCNGAVVVPRSSRQTTGSVPGAASSGRREAVKRKLDRRRAAKEGYGRRREDRTLLVLTCSGVAVVALVLLVLVLSGGDDEAGALGSPGGRTPGEVRFLCTAEVYLKICFSLSNILRNAPEAKRSETRPIAPNLEAAAYAVVRRTFSEVVSTDLLDLKNAVAETHRRFGSSNVDGACRNGVKQIFGHLEAFFSDLRESLGSPAEENEAEMLLTALAVGRKAWAVAIMAEAGVRESGIDRLERECKSEIRRCRDRLNSYLEQKHPQLVDALKAMGDYTSGSNSMRVARLAIEGMFRIKEG